MGNVRFWIYLTSMGPEGIQQFVELHVFFLVHLKWWQHSAHGFFMYSTVTSWYGTFLYQRRTGVLFGADIFFQTLTDKCRRNRSEKSL